MNVSNSINIIKTTNEGLVLSEVLKNTDFTKRSLSDITRLTFPTVSRIIDDMESKQQIIKMGLSTPANGRKATVYRLNPDYAHILTIYFQYDKFFCAVGTATREIISISQSELIDNDYIYTLEKLITDYLISDTTIKLISIGVPAGVVDGQIKFINHYEQLRDFNLTMHIKKKFNIKTVIERDMNALIHGITLQKNYADDKNLSVIILTADGPGAATMLDGNIIRGFSGFAGEVGYLPLYNDTNLQQIAENNFVNADIVDYTVRLILCITIMLNPQKIVLIENEYSPKNVDELLLKCKQHVPYGVMPKLEISNCYHENYRDGLIVLGSQLLFDSLEY